MIADFQKRYYQAFNWFINNKSDPKVFKTQNWCLLYKGAQ